MLGGQLIDLFWFVSTSSLIAVYTKSLKQELIVQPGLLRPWKVYYNESLLHVAFAKGYCMKLCVSYDKQCIRWSLRAHDAPVWHDAFDREQEQTLFKDLRRQDIEIKNETKKEWDLLNGFLIKGSWMINGSHPKKKSY